MKMRYHITRRLPLLILVCLLLGMGQGACLAEKVVEHYEDDGPKKAEYVVKNGLRIGDYTEYYLTGKIRVKAKYKKGKLEGDYVVYHVNGQPKIQMKYKKGKRHGPYIELDEDGKLVAAGEYVKDLLHGKYKTYTRGKTDRIHQLDAGQLVMFRGKEVHPRTLDDMTYEFQEIRKATPKFESATPDQIAALHRLNSYRYLCGVPYDVQLGMRECEKAQQDAEILGEDEALEGEELGGDQLGVPDESPLEEGANNDPYGVEATYPDHLAVRIPDDVDPLTATAGIDVMMADDGPPPNDSPFEEGEPQGLEAEEGPQAPEKALLPPLTFRRECLAPTMSKVGFGRTGNFAVMTKHKPTKKKMPDWQMISHPAPGYTPVDYFSADRPWMVIVNHRAFKSIIREKGIQVRPIEDSLRLGKELKLNHRREFAANVHDPDAPPHQIIYFYPENVDLTVGKRYWVQITGFQRVGGSVDPLEYMVEIAAPLDLTKKVKKPKKKRKKSTRRKR